MVKDYFEQLIETLEKKYTVRKNISLFDINCNISHILNYEIDNRLKDIYSKYSELNLIWHEENRYVGGFIFVPAYNIENEHRSLVRTMEDNYDIELDNMKIKDNILNWYPLFYFPNGDAFCIDKRTNGIYFYEHELYDQGVNINGLKIANNINQLFQKWSAIEFKDLYYWDDYVNEDGIDIMKVKSD